LIGRDPERAFAAVNDLTDGRAPAWSVSTRRTSEDQAIEAMGFHEGADKNGFRFVCTW
jgi:hypothetical protein